MFTKGLTYQTTVTMVTEECCNCGVVFGIPSDLQQRFKNDPSMSFYCPNGHGQHYSKSALQIKLDRANKLREEAEDMASRALSQKLQLEADLQNQHEALKKERKKLTRLQKGVCPCCTRSFQNLKRHMETQHPEQVGKIKVPFTAKKHHNG